MLWEHRARKKVNTELGAVEGFTEEVVFELGLEERVLLSEAEESMEGPAGQDD